MNTQTIDQIVVRTHADVLTRNGAQQIIEHVQRLLTNDIQWVEVVDLCSGRPATLTDAVQYTLDVLNDEAPEGYWYYITSDANLALECEDDS